MTEHNNKPETFVEDEIVFLYQGSKYNRKLLVSAVNGDAVTVKIANRETVFTPRVSDGKMVKVGSHGHKNPLIISHVRSSRWKDALDFLHGMFWGS